MARGPGTLLAVFIDDYRIACEAGTHKRPLSPYTIVGYMKALHELDTLLGHPTLEDFTLEAVADVITAKRAVSASNARLIAAVAKAFSRWLLISGKTPTHILETLGVPTFNAYRTAFTDAEFRAVRRALLTLPNRTRKRDRALVLFAMGSGARSNELRTVAYDDVHIETPLSDSWALLRWHTTKAKRQRKVTIADDAAAAIHEYIANDRLDRDPRQPGGGPLFLRESGKPFSYLGWGKYFGSIADAVETAGIPEFNAHKLRHQWATMGARTGMTQAELCQEGGWERGSKVPARYIDEIPFSEIQQRGSPMTAFLRRVG